MRWIPFGIFAYVIIVLQSSVVRLITLPTRIGTVGPDLAVLVAVFVAFYARSSIDAMLAGWLLGLGLDLTTGGAVGAMSVVGPMPIAFALSAGLVHRVREAIFRERAVAQVIVTFLYCFLAHVLWVTLQSLRMGGVSWAGFGRVVLQAVAVAAYTAALAPLAHAGLWRVRRWLIAPAVGRTR